MASRRKRHTSRQERKPQERAESTRAKVERLLELNARLSEFLPAVTDRADALQVTRETIGSWDRRHVERVRSANIARLETVLVVCDAARRYLPTEHAVGVWLKSPQTFLYGLTPLQYLHENGEPDLLVDTIPPPAAKVGESTASAYRKVRPKLAALVEPTRQEAAATKEAPQEARRGELVVLPPSVPTFANSAAAFAGIDIDRLLSAGLRESLENTAKMARLLDESSVAALLEQQQRQAEMIRRIYDFPAIERKMAQLMDWSVPPALLQATSAHLEVMSLVGRLPQIPEVTELLKISESVTRATAALHTDSTSELARELDRALAPAIASWRTLAEAIPPAPSVRQVRDLDVLGTGTLAITETTALMVRADVSHAEDTPRQFSALALQERTRLRVGALSPRLVERIEGAWVTLERQDKDFASQSANSGVEFIDWLLRLSCSVEEVQEWLEAGNEGPGDRDGHKRPTRRAKIRFLMRSRPVEAAAAVALSEAILEVHRQLEKVKHSNKTHAAETVSKLLWSVEALTSYILGEETDLIRSN